MKLRIISMKLKIADTCLELQSNDEALSNYLDLLQRLKQETPESIEILIHIYESVAILYYEKYFIISSN